MAVVVRPAEPADIPFLMRLYTEFHNFHAAGVPAYLAQLPETDDPSLYEAISRIIANGDALLLVAVAEPNQTVVGLAEAYLKQTDPTPALVQKQYVLLQSLAVTAACRRQGTGEQLMAGVHEWAVARGAVEMRTDVWEFPGGPQAFYEKLGYAPVKLTLARSLV